MASRSGRDHYPAAGHRTHGPPGDRRDERRRAGPVLVWGKPLPRPNRAARGSASFRARRMGGPADSPTSGTSRPTSASSGASPSAASLYVLSSQPLATLNITVQGHGTVSVAPYGASCRSTCSVQFAPGAELDLTATADLPGWRFTRWQGACSGSSVTCQLRLDATTSVSAVFHAADTTAPTTSPPATRLRPGSRLSSGVPPAIPLTTSWTATDPDDPVRQQDLLQPIATCHPRRCPPHARQPHDPHYPSLGEPGQNRT